MNLTDALPKIASQDDVEAVLAAMATDEAKYKTRCAERDSEITKVRQKYTDVDELLKRLQNGEAALEAWTVEKKKELSRGKRSVEFRHGVVGRRWGNEKLVCRANVTFKDVLDRVKAARKRFGKWLRKTEELDLRKMLQAAKGDKPKLSADDLAEMGLKLTQDDNFYYELKQETPEA